MALTKRKPDGISTVEKGEVIFKEGEPATRLFLIKSGLISVTVDHLQGKTEIFQATAPQVIGTELLTGAQTYKNSATAMNDTEIVEFPVKVWTELLSRGATTLQLVAKNIVQKHQSILAKTTEVKVKSADKTPCPAQCLPKLFATLFHVISYTGELDQKNEWHKVVWPAFKKYCQRVFLESPVRLEQTAYFLSTMGMSKIEMVKSDVDPEAPEEIGFVYFKNVKQFEFFSKFVRKRLESCEVSEVLKPDQVCMQMADVLLRNFGSRVTDRASAVDVPIDEAVQTLKPELGSDKLDQKELERLASRGIPMMIRLTTRGTFLTFTPQEIEMFFLSWRIVGKIEEWNKAGRAPGAPEPEEEQKENGGA